MSQGNRILSLIAIGALLVVTLYLSTHLYTVEVEVDEGLQGEAAVYPLLAAERFFEGMGIPSQRVERLDRAVDQLGNKDALLVLGDRQTMGEELSQQLLNWVEGGGRLLITISHLDDETERPYLHDHLLELMGLEVHPSPCETENYYSDIDLPWARDFLQVRFDYCYTLAGGREDDFLVRDDEGVQILRRHQGLGTITIVSDLDFITELSLGNYDHAEVLWYLVDGQGTVWMATHSGMPALPQWLWDKAPAAIVSALLLLLAWLMTAGRRLGPLLPDPIPSRRRIMEHIEASGRYLWKQDKHEMLTGAMKDDLERTARRRHPGWADMSAEERARHIAETTGMTTEAAHHLLHAETPKHRHEFTTLIRRLNTLKERL
jgi:hypothetical protein